MIRSKATRLTIAAATLALVGVPLVGVGPASADTPGCVSKAEYKKATHGMQKAKVHRIFDTSGRQSSTYNISGTHYETRDYKPCTNPKYGFVGIDYKNGKVDGKYAYWG